MGVAPIGCKARFRMMYIFSYKLAETVLLPGLGEPVSPKESPCALRVQKMGSCCGATL